MSVLVHQSHLHSQDAHTGASLQSKFSLSLIIPTSYNISASPNRSDSLWNERNSLRNSHNSLRLSIIPLGIGLLPYRTSSVPYRIAPLPQGMLDFLCAFLSFPMESVRRDAIIFFYPLNSLRLRCSNFVPLIKGDRP